MKTISFFTLLTLPWAVFADDSPTAEGLAFFETKIRPVLSESCYQCHSEKALTAGMLQGQLLLDTRDGIRKGGESGPAVVPNDVAASLLISAIRHESFEMPPKTQLSLDVISDFVRWVELGAPDPRTGNAVTLEHKAIDVEEGKKAWAFQPLQNAPPPDLRSDWIRTDIDRFILAKLNDTNTPPNNAADRVTLIRRLYFDLWGLPPERDAVEAFAEDESPDAYELLIDHLLAGQHYGERWARHWLDLARFAESNGYAFDIDRPAAFHYRDFTIKALNDDMPYDEFVRLQLAGDIIAPHDYMAQAATGFLAAGTFTSQQTQKERERSRYEQLDDVVGTLGTAMLGLTIGCARCHDHKFDPVSHHDYYRFAANFAETGFQNYDWDPDPEGTKKALAAYNIVHQPFVDARTKYETDVLPGQLLAWESAPVKSQPDPQLSHWQHIGPFEAADYEQAFTKTFPPETAIDITKPVADKKWTEKPEWTDGTIHNTLTGDLSANYLFRTLDVPSALSLDISLGADDGIKVFLNGKSVLNKPTMGGVKADQHTVTLNLLQGRNELLLKIVNNGGPSGFYFIAKSLVTPQKIQDILNLDHAQRDAEQAKELLAWFGPRDQTWARLNKAEKEHAATKPEPQLTPIYAARTGGTTYNFGEDTRKVYFLARGNPNSKTGLASPAYLRVLMNGDRQEQTWLTADHATETPTRIHPRVALANWLSDTDLGAGNLLARVIVNRLWQHHFGTGIVNTPNNFGLQGSRPTHPQLLDFLAARLIAAEWKLKPIHKLIIMSAVYRQAGASNQSGLQNDPDNRLLWRKSPMRMDAEIIRDHLLTVSGSLDTKMFGAGSLEEENPRRSIYLTVKRDKLVPLLQLFDAPDAIQSIGARGITTVPPQALAMMNSALVRQMAEKLSERLQQKHGTALPEIVDAAFWRTLSRPPTADETAQMTRFISEQARRHTPQQTAVNTAITDYCQLMLCLNEFLYVD